MVMVGRSGELRQLTSAWRRVTAGRHGAIGRRGGAGKRGRAGQPGTVLVTGEPGVGKSLLAATAVGGFEPRPSVVLTGAARVHSPAPYDWLGSVLSGQPDARPSVPAEALAWLAQHPDAPRERYTPDSLLRMAVRVVRDLVGDGPAVLVVEDLHALDPAGLHLVAELAAAPGLPALLLVTSELSEAPLVSRTLARLCGVPGTVRAHLAALGPAEVGGLLATRYADVPATVLDAVMERTGGNPYRLTELVAMSPSLDDLGAPATELTAREHEVLSCLANGMSNKQIARSLGISIRTVTVHVSNLLRKTGSASRTEAALWAVRHQPVAGG